MFFDAGRWRDYIFVYNTDDCSCKMLKESIKCEYDLHEADLKLQSVNKLRMLYSFNTFGRWCSKTVLTYRLKVYNDIDSSCIKDVICILCLRLCLDNDTAFIRVCVTNSESIKNVDEFHKDIDFNGIEIPCVMIPYIFDLIRSHDFYGLMNAFDGIFFENLKLSDFGGSNYSVYDKYFYVEAWE